MPGDLACWLLISIWDLKFGAIQADLISIRVAMKL
jgi:hypothetical protein